jgi:hypothetical protein
MSETTKQESLDCSEPQWMPRDKAARYFIVGWVKDWSWWAYYTVLTGKTRYTPALDAELRRRYPWFIDAHQRHGVWLNRMSMRGWLASRYPRVSDAMWDAPDDGARLALFPKILTLDGTAPNVRGRDRDLDSAKYHVRRHPSVMRAVGVHKTNFDRCNGHHWKTVK